MDWYETNPNLFFYELLLLMNIPFDYFQYNNELKNKIIIK